MRRLLVAAAMLCACATATRADVILDPHLSGTGDNVVFDSVSGNLALAHLNGQHADVVDFTNLGGGSAFTGSANGNDIKIAGTNNLAIQVFDPTNTTVVGTLTQVFSLKGTGSVTAFVSANDANGIAEAIKSFNLGTIDANAQSGFTFSAINGEVMTKLVLLDVGGTLTDFEHYRIDVAPAVTAVPGPIAGAGLPGLIAACGMLFGLHRRRRNRLA